jgi:hypothetical protein
VSDLQCAARVLLVDPAVAESVAGLLRERRPAALHHDPSLAEAHRAAATLGRELGLASGPHDELTVTTYRNGLAGLADLHRGETVVAVVGQEVLGLVAAGHPSAQVVEVAVDADGWAVTTVV